MLLSLRDENSLGFVFFKLEAATNLSLFCFSSPFWCPFESIFAKTTGDFSNLFFSYIVCKLSSDMTK